MVSLLLHNCRPFLPFRSLTWPSLPPSISPDDWQRGDYLLQSWIYNTISDDLSSMVFSKTAIAHDLWNSLASLFTTTRIIVQFILKKSSSPSKRTLFQSMITARKLKQIADNLAEFIVRSFESTPPPCSPIVKV